MKKVNWDNLLDEIDKLDAAEAIRSEEGRLKYVAGQNEILSRYGITFDEYMHELGRRCRSLGQM